MQASPPERIRARDGYGPLLVRDYWARIAASRLSPSAFGDLLAHRFEELVPSSLAAFERDEGRRGSALEVGDELTVHIRFAGPCRVRVLHRDKNSLTLGTLAGHPESGRITFGAYRHDDGTVLFHIRSVARASTRPLYLGFVAVGTSMQANTWAGFIERVASRVGDGVDGFVYEDTHERDDEDASLEDGPTFVAKGD